MPNAAVQPFSVLKKYYKHPLPLPMRQALLIYNILKKASLFKMFLLLMKTSWY
jgi:hypothetical protein